MRNRASIRIGYLPFYVDYYEAVCPDFPVEKKSDCERLAGLLGRFGEVVWDGRMIRDQKQAAEAGRFCTEQAVDCVVIYTSIAVFSAIPLAALCEVERPLLLCNVQQIETIAGDYAAKDMLRHTGQVGIQALANTLLRKGRDFRVVTGHEKEARLHAEIGAFLKLVRVSRNMRTARLLAIGDPFPAMLDVLIDERSLKEDLGIEVTHVDMDQLTQEFSSVPVERVTARIATIRKEHPVRSIEETEIRRSAQLAEAVESLVQQHGGIDAGSLNCHGTCLRNPVIGVAACYALGDQTARGRPFSCTGDLPTAVAMLLLKDLTGVSLYTEIQVMDEQRDALLLANSGEGDPGICRRGADCSLRGNSNFKGVEGHGLSYHFPLQNGPATVVSFTPTPSGPNPFRLIVAEGWILEETPKSESLTGYFRFQTSPQAQAYTCWLEAGPVHHAATTTGHWARDLETLAGWLNLEFVKI